MVKEKDCVFCKMIKGEIKVDKIYEDDNFFAIKDINPVIDGHTLVICKKHYENLVDAPSSIYGEFLEAAEKVAMKLMKEMKADGFNIHMNNFEAAGQLIPHIHLHVLPRKKGDGFKVCA